MLPFGSTQLLHRHGDDWLPLEPVTDHTSVDHDVERRLLRGDRLYRCDECDLEILVVPPDVDESA